MMRPPPPLDEGEEGQAGLLADPMDAGFLAHVAAAQGAALHRRVRGVVPDRAAVDLAEAGQQAVAQRARLLARNAGREEGAERQLAAGVEQQVDALPGGEQTARVLSRDPLRPAQAAGALAQRAQIRDGVGGGGVGGCSHRTSRPGEGSPWRRIAATGGLDGGGLPRDGSGRLRPKPVADLEGVGELEDLEVGLVAADDPPQQQSIVRLTLHCTRHNRSHSFVVLFILRLDQFEHILQYGRGLTDSREIAPTVGNCIAVRVDVEESFDTGCCCAVKSRLPKDRRQSVC